MEATGCTPLAPSTRTRTFRPMLAALLFAALRLKLQVAEKQEKLHAQPST